MLCAGPTGRNRPVTRRTIRPRMTLHVNGEDRELPDGTTVAGLVRRLNLTPEKVAVERNRRLVRRDGYDAPLADGDTVEIVTFVGGG